jgi:hypothetical protein
VKRIGSPSEPRTDIIMGFDFKYESQLMDIDMQRHLLRLDIDQVKAHIEDLGRQVLPKLERQKIELELKKEWLLLKVKKEKLIKEIKTLENKAFCDGVSELIVHRELHANTMIHLLRGHRRINEELCGVRVKIDVKNKEVSFEELGS